MKKIIIEVGANRGQDTEKYVNQENSYVYCIEPVPKLIQKLREKFQEYSNIEFFQLAISDYNGKSNFGLSAPFTDGLESSMACSSLYNFVENPKQKWGEERNDFFMTEHIEVDVMRMDTFIEQNKIEVIDFFHCDSQGADLRILESFGKYLKLIKAGKCEASNTVNLYDGADNSYEKVEEFLELNGFRITEISDHFGTRITRPMLKRATQEVDIHFERI